MRLSLFKMVPRTLIEATPAEGRSEQSSRLFLIARQRLEKHCASRYTMPTEQLYAPDIVDPLTFDPIADLLGAGTVSEVFRVTVRRNQLTTLTVRLKRKELCT
jgi:hypothetical protein